MKKYPPERIIATTFTRAAAAEIQERISERLHSFYGLMRWLQGMLSTQPEWFNQTAPIEQIITSADQAGYDAADPINEHLLRFILSQKATFLNEVVYRTGLLLTSLDKLFVGTLDSLAQKWLNEFAAQIGHQSGMEILNNAEQKLPPSSMMRCVPKKLGLSTPSLNFIKSLKYFIQIFQPSGCCCQDC